MKCTHAPCPGTIEDGYCDTCGLAPAPATGTAASGSPASTRTAPASTRAGASTRSLSTRSGSTGTGSGRTGSRRRMGGGLVDMAPLPTRDPATAVMAVAEVPEPRRFCASCHKPVGRGRDGKPGRTAGFCPSCGTPFSFTPKLHPGDLAGGQYKVVGALAHGGLGWIYLATDRNVSDRWVVLKGLLNAGDRAATAAAVAERRFLAEVEHPNIVKIYNFVEHDGAGYIVMEYVGGESLKDILKARRGAADRPSPLPPEQALAYLIEVMPAFSYLHGRNLLFCDFKPDNVIQSGDLVKLIDLGAVVRAGDPDADIYGTVGYQAPEIAETGPTVASDLYTIARALAVLSIDFRGYQTTFVDSLPEAADIDLFRRFDSFYRLLARGTHRDPQARFTSADEMAEQMLGVLREVLAAAGTPRPGPSTLFTTEQRTDSERGSGPQWQHLPAPMVDLTDPAAAFLASITVTDPAEVLTLLGNAPQPTIEVALRELRAQIDLAAAAPAGTSDPYATAKAAVAKAAAEYGNDWRIAWYDAVLALAEGDTGRASDQFDAVYACLPGELAPKLALAFASELAGDPATAAAFYDVVSRTDPAYTTAHAGLARCRLARGDRAGAVEAYARVPGTSAAYRISQVEAVRALVAAADGTAAPDPASLAAAAARIDTLEVTTAQLAELRAELLTTALGALQSGATIPAAVLGPGRSPTQPAGERDLRFALEGCYREMARAAIGDDRIRLVDTANQVRPRTRT